MNKVSSIPENKKAKVADWEVDFYSRPIIEVDGKKRWELLISSTQDFSGDKPFAGKKNVLPMKLIQSG